MNLPVRLLLSGPKPSYKEGMSRRRLERSIRALGIRGDWTRRCEHVKDALRHSFVVYRDPTDGWGSGLDGGLEENDTNDAQDENQSSGGSIFNSLPSLVAPLALRPQRRVLGDITERYVLAPAAGEPHDRQTAPRFDFGAPRLDFGAPRLEDDGFVYSPWTDWDNLLAYRSSPPLRVGA